MQSALGVGEGFRENVASEPSFRTVELRCRVGELGERERKQEFVLRSSAWLMRGGKA